MGTGFRAERGSDTPARLRGEVEELGVQVASSFGWLEPAEGLGEEGRLLAAILGFLLNPAGKARQV